MCALLGKQQSKVLWLVLMFLSSLSRSACNVRCYVSEGIAEVNYPSKLLQLLGGLIASGQISNEHFYPVIAGGKVSQSL
jgi:hypothetical protein